jgi:hypothetical protein
MPRNGYSIRGQFQTRLIEMLESPAHRALSLSALRILDRISIELGHHGGQDNGSLPCTYTNFVDFGIDRHAIAPAIRELVALGFVEVTERGRPGNGEFRTPNLYRLTFQPILRRNKAPVQPTHDWRGIDSLDAALLLAKAARQASDRPKARSRRPTPVSHPEHC